MWTEPSRANLPWWLTVLTVPDAGSASQHPELARRQRSLNSASTELSLGTSNPVPVQAFGAALGGGPCARECGLARGPSRLTACRCAPLIGDAELDLRRRSGSRRVMSLLAPGDRSLVVEAPLLGSGDGKPDDEGDHLQRLRRPRRVVGGRADTTAACRRSDARSRGGGGGIEVRHRDAELQVRREVVLVAVAAGTWCSTTPEECSRYLLLRCGRGGWS